MNRREAVTGLAAAAAMVAGYPVSAKADTPHIQPADTQGTHYPDDPIRFSIAAVVDDPDVSQIVFTAYLKPETRGKELDSMFMERVALKWIGNGGIYAWAQHCRDKNQKTIKIS